ncbi:MAG: oligosaccharide flippase family protein [Bacteroidota bacterium]
MAKNVLTETGMDNQFRPSASIWSLKSGVSLTVLSRLLLLGLGLIANIITARFLGPEGRGEFFFVITIAGMIVQFGNFGLHAGNTYLVAQERSLMGSLLANSFWLSLSAGVFAVLIIVIFQVFNFFAGIPGWQLWMAAALAPVTLFYMLGVNLLVGINRIKAFNLFEIANRLAGCIGLSIAALILGGVQEFLSAALIAAIIPAIVLFVLLYKRYGDGLRFRRTVFTKGFHYAFKAYLVALIGFLTTQVIILLLRYLGGSKEVGYYSVGCSIGNVLAILPTSVALVLFPRLVGENERRREMTLKNTLVVGGIIMVACLITAFLAKPLIIFLFGRQFQPVVPVLYWMLPGIFFYSMVNVLSQYLAAIGFPRILIGVWAVGFLTVLGLGYLFIPIGRSVGAAISVSVTQVLLFIMHFGLVWSGKFQKD